MLSRLRSNVSLSPYHTFGIEVKTKFLIAIDNEIEVQELIVDHFYSAYPLLILGGGSNMLFTRDFEGITLLNQIKGIEIVREDSQSVWIRVGGGEVWHELVEYCLANDWGGLENLSLIPGSVGAAPIQNIGAYGVELCELFHSLEAVDLHTGTIRRFDKEECQFGYRDSIFKRQLKGRYLISRVHLRLAKPPHKLTTSYGVIGSELAQLEEEPSIQSLSKLVCAIRQRKLPDPKQIGNAGSFFKNPVISVIEFDRLLQQYPDIPSYPQEDGQIKIPAAWLIQTAGWKGKRRGTFGVHPHQALVLVNYGGAEGQDIYQLAEEIKVSVWDQFNIQLECEVNVM
ncbi:MAG: UDP-N-acetylmuramate dehydrogenase [Bacteroidota bacterium]